jgi:hypothetical protein
MSTFDITQTTGILPKQTLKEIYNMAAKKLGKKIEQNEVVFNIGEEEVRYDTALLSQEVKDRLVVFGAGHKLGDSAASAKTPEDMKKNIQRVWDGMIAGNWSTRVPGEERERTPKISQKTILANLEKLPVEQQEAAKALLASMGILL